MQGAVVKLLLNSTLTVLDDGRLALAKIPISEFVLYIISQPAKKAQATLDTLTEPDIVIGTTTGEKESIAMGLEGVYER